MHAVMDIVGSGRQLFILPSVIDSDGEVCKFCDTQFVNKLLNQSKCKLCNMQAVKFFGC